MKRSFFTASGDLKILSNAALTLGPGENHRFSGNTPPSYIYWAVDAAD
jgi:hypothetical protein